jgi:hypothetical protein
MLIVALLASVIAGEKMRQRRAEYLAKSEAYAELMAKARRTRAMALADDDRRDLAEFYERVEAFYGEVLRNSDHVVSHPWAAAPPDPPGPPRPGTSK